MNRDDTRDGAPWRKREHLLSRQSFLSHQGQGFPTIHSFNSVSGPVLSSRETAGNPGLLELTSQGPLRVPPGTPTLSEVERAYVFTT